MVAHLSSDLLSRLEPFEVHTDSEALRLDSLGSLPEDMKIEQYSSIPYNGRDLLSSWDYYDTVLYNMLSHLYFPAPCFTRVHY